MATASWTSSGHARNQSAAAVGKAFEPGLRVFSTLASTEDRADRVRAVFGLASGGNLPRVHPVTLRTYYEFLRARLTMPFVADYCPANEPVICGLTVVGLLTPKTSAGDVSRGLFCLARDPECVARLPLVDLEVPEDDPNFQLVEDYWYWAWNWGRESAFSAEAERQATFS